MVKKTTMITGYIYIYTHTDTYMNAPCPMSTPPVPAAFSVPAALPESLAFSVPVAFPTGLRSACDQAAGGGPPAEPEPDDELLWAELMAIELSVGRLNVGGEVHART